MAEQAKATSEWTALVDDGVGAVRTFVKPVGRRGVLVMVCDAKTNAPGALTFVPAAEMADFASQ